MLVFGKCVCVCIMLVCVCVYVCMVDVLGKVWFVGQVEV